MKSKKVIKKIKKARKPKVKKIATIAKGIDIVKRPDGSMVVSGKNAKSLEGAIVEYKEREYQFDDRLVPYHLGADTKEGNLTLREALIKLGKTPAMTDLFLAMKSGNLGYREDGRESFVKALLAVIKGHDEVGLAHVYEQDIELIHNNNLKVFNEYWDAKARIMSPDADLFEGFDN